MHNLQLGGVHKIISTANQVVSVVFQWLRNERSGIRFSHTWVGVHVWVQV